MPKFLVRITFAAGFFIGFLLSYLLIKTPKQIIQPKTRFESKNSTNCYETWFKQQNLERRFIPMDTLRYSNSHYLTESKYLFDKIRILCLILVQKAKYVKSSIMTWAKQCNSIELLQMKRNKTTLKRDKKDAAWPLLCNTLINTSNLFHWVLIVNDKTFALIENVRYLVAPLNHSSQYYLGHAIEFWGIKYNIGEAGYILSNGTLDALKMKSKTDLCSTDSIIWNLEDYYLGKTLTQLNITVTDTRDEIGFSTFHGFNLQKLFFPGSTTMSKYYKRSVYPVFCCSPKSVTFQVSNSNSMYTYEYILNTLQIFTSGTLGNRKPTTPIGQEEVWKSVLREHGQTNTNISAEEYYEFWVDLVSDPQSFAQMLKNNN